jgi:hypothetical protein
LVAAQECNPLTARACAGFVEDECGCPVSVNSSSSTYTNRYEQALATYQSRCSIACPAVLCREPIAAGCEGGILAEGRCVAHYSGVSVSGR